MNDIEKELGESFLALRNGEIEKKIEETTKSYKILTERLGSSLSQLPDFESIRIKSKIAAIVAPNQMDCFFDTYKRLLAQAAFSSLSDYHKLGLLESAVNIYVVANVNVCTSLLQSAFEKK